MTTQLITVNYCRCVTLWGKVKEVRVGNEKFVIREPKTPEEHRELMDVEVKIWGGEGYSETVPYHVTLSLKEVGGLVLGIYDPSGKVIGVSICFPAIIKGKLALYAHMLGFLKEYRYRGLGFEVKKIQIEYARSLGIDLVLWTYDPLLTANAWFNMVKLGAVFRRYSPNHYGRMGISYNIGVDSDRVWAEWYINSKRVKQRMEGKLKPKDLSYFLSLGARYALKSDSVRGGLKIPGKPQLGLESRLVIIEVPPNFVEIQMKDSDLANVWRLKSREVFMYYLSRGYVGFEFVRHEDSYYYVLWKERLSEILKGAYP